MKSIKIAAQLLQKNKSYSATHKMYSIFICRISQTNTNIRTVSWWLNKQTFSSVETELTSSRRLYRYSIQLNNLNIYRTRRKVLGINAPIENFNFFPFHIKIAVCVCVCVFDACVCLSGATGAWPVASVTTGANSISSMAEWSMSMSCANFFPSAFIAIWPNSKQRFEVVFILGRTHEQRRAQTESMCAWMMNDMLPLICITAMSNNCEPSELMTSLFRSHCRPRHFKFEQIYAWRHTGSVYTRISRRNCKRQSWHRHIRSEPNLLAHNRINRMGSELFIILNEISIFIFLASWEFWALAFPAHIW